MQIKLPLVVLDQTPCRQHNGWTIDKRGKAVGYFVYDAALDDLCVLEVGHARPDVFSDIFRAVARMTWQRRLASFRFRLPEDDELMRHGLDLGLKKEVI